MLTTIKDLIFDVGMLIVVGIFVCLLFGDVAMLVVLVIFGVGNP